MTPPGTGKKVGLGPTGETVRENVERLRAGTQFKELSGRLTELGRPIPPLGLRRIEAGERRVDADDLMALAVALGVTPSSLLLPHVDYGDLVDLTGAPSVDFNRAWHWADGMDPLSEESERERVAFLARSRPLGKAAQVSLATAGERRVSETQQLIADLAGVIHRLRDVNAEDRGPEPEGLDETLVAVDELLKLEPSDGDD